MKVTFRGTSFEVYKQRGYNDFVDEAVVLDRWWCPGPGHLVVDVGAGRGSYTLPSLASGAHVVAFSPETIDTEILAANLDANPGFAQLCDLRRVGVYSQAGWMELIAGSYRFASERPSGLCFPVTRLDDAVAAADWIKIDVEGNEVEALRGGAALIARCRPRLLVENHLFMDSTLERRVSEFVQSLGLGYSVITVPHHSVSHSFFEVT